MAFALCTISSDRYVNGTATMIHSFLRTNPWFSGDIVVFHSAHLSPLSDNGMKSILKINDKIKFKKVDDLCYDNMYKHFKSRIPVNREVRALRFETFVLGGYDKVMYADSDMLFLGSVEEMFNQDSSITITRDGWGGRVFTDPIKCVKNGVSMNGGLFVVSSDAVGKCYKPSLIKYGEKYNMSEYDCVMYDQSVMNKFFKNTSVVIMPNKFNVNRKWISDSKKCPIDDIRAIHFCDEKPWISVPNGYKKSIDLWNKEFKMFDIRLHEVKPILKEVEKPVKVKETEVNIKVDNTDVKIDNKPIKEENIKNTIQKESGIIKNHSNSHSRVNNVKPKPKVNVEIFDVKYENLNFPYALITNFTNETFEMLKTFIVNNPWYNGLICIKGTCDVSKFKSLYSNVIIYNGEPDGLMDRFNKIMYLDSSKRVTCNLYGLFIQNHEVVEIVPGNEDIRMKTDTDVTDPGFFFKRKNGDPEYTVLFPSSYIK